MSLSTEKEYLKQQLRQAQVERDKYKTLFDTSADAMFILDLQQAKFVDCNQAAVDMHCVKNKDEFLQLAPIDISPSHQPCATPSERLSKEYIHKAIS